jgi:hypothetical protein
MAAPTTARPCDRVNRPFLDERDKLSRIGTGGTGGEQKARESRRRDSGFSFMKKSLSPGGRREKTQAEA